MKSVDTTVFVVTKDNRVKPEDIDLGELPPIQKTSKSPDEPSNQSAAVPSRSHASVPSRSHAVTPSGSHAIMPSRSLDGTTLAIGADHIANVVPLIQEVGTEKGTVRLTKREKAALGRVVYNYRQSGLAVSENEIMRIALNYLLKEDDGIRIDTVLGRILSSLKK